MNRLEELKKKLKEEREWHKLHWKEFWYNLKPFKTPDDIPDVPIVSKEMYEEVVVRNLIRCGAIPKSELIVGKTYEGSCRNSSTAVWNGKEFEYKRYKWGMWEDDSVNHFEDDDGSDVFVPIKMID